MAKGKLGASTSTIENTRNIRSIACDCNKCFHSNKRGTTLYCRYYDEFQPHKKKCVRFEPRIVGKTFKESKKKQSGKKPKFPWEE